MAPSGAVVTMPNNRPTICTADEQNCVAITSRVHFDVGGYDYHPNTAATVPQKLDSGDNVRRARIGVLGKFFSDWNFALIYDFGGSSDGFGGTASAGGVLSASCPAAARPALRTPISAIPGSSHSAARWRSKAASWTSPTRSTRPRARTTSCSWNALPRRSSRTISPPATSAPTFGTRWWNDIFWAGAYVTGPTTGAIHSASSINPARHDRAVWRDRPRRRPDHQRQRLLAASRRRRRVADPAAAQPGDAPRRRSRSAIVPSCASIPTTLISTGAIANASGAQVYSVEAAATYGSLLFQGEYFWFNVDRSANTGLPPIGAPSLNFQGGYAQASYMLTGEIPRYNPASASYGGIKPANPFSLYGGGWGAWEIAGRVSMMDLNDQLATATGIAGGQQLSIRPA